MISSASRGLRHIGFSTSTWMPASSAAIVHSAWYSSELRTKTQSRPPAAISSCASAYRCSTRYRSPSRFTRPGEMSQIAASSYSSDMDSMMGRWMTWATSPSPITPTRSLLTVMPLSGGGGSDLGPGRVVRGGALDGVEHPLDLQAVGEGRSGGGARGDVAHEVGDLVHEGVLVPEAMAGRPPRCGVGMVG